MRHFFVLLTLSALVALPAACADIALPGVLHSPVATPEPPLGSAPGVDPAEPAGPPTITPSTTPLPTPTYGPPPDRIQVPILMYHHLEDLGPRASALMHNLTVSPKQFEDEVAYLVDNNYHTISFADLVAALNEGKPLPENPVILTFDDAWNDDYNVAFPILRKYGMTGTFFVPTGWMGAVQNALTWSQIEEMDRAGMEFGSHSISHPWLTRQKASAVKRELEQSKATLEEHLGHPVVAHAYPFGAVNKSVIEQTRQAGYLAAVGIQPGWWATKDGLLKLNRTGIPYGLSLKSFAKVLRPAGAKQATPTAVPMLDQS